MTTKLGAKKRKGKRSNFVCWGTSMLNLVLLINVSYLMPSIQYRIFGGGGGGNILYVPSHV
jgi:hypothetical protein